MLAKTASKAVFNLLILSALVVSTPFAGPAFKTINTDQLHSRIMDNAYRLEGGRAKAFTIADARPHKDYERDHIFSAISSPEEDFERTMSSLPKDKGAEVVVYCNDGDSGTSVKWVGKAAAHGYTNIIVYAEGFSTWKRQHMPTASLGAAH